MSPQTSDNKRIAKNTLLLYFRMLFMMVVSLYASHTININKRCCKYWDNYKEIR